MPWHRQCSDVSLSAWLQRVAPIQWPIRLDLAIALAHPIFHARLWLHLCRVSKFLCTQAAGLLVKARSTTNRATWLHVHLMFEPQMRLPSRYQVLERRGSWGRDGSQSQHKKIKKLFSPRKASCNMPKASIFDFFYNSKFGHFEANIDHPYFSGNCQPLDRPHLARTENIRGRYFTWICQYFASQFCAFGFAGCVVGDVGFGSS